MEEHRKEDPEEKTRRQTEEGSPPFSRSARSRAWDRTKDIFFMVVAVLFIRTFVVQAYQIPTGSMENTLLVGDFLIANKFIYGPRIPFTPFKIKGMEPKRGDIVIFRSPTDEKDFIKRCIALPGESLEIRDNQVFIDGEYLEEDYIYLGEGSSRKANFGPIIVPEGRIFVLGDNRNSSYDSRYWGALDEDRLKGKAEVIHWSWDKDAHKPRLKRVGDLLR